ncbi:hypothetical protein AB4381_24195 [Vibrio splendidus]
MEKYSNSAYRILNLVEKAKHSGGNTITSTVWANVFGLDGDLAVRDPHLVTQKLTLLRTELDCLSASMATTKFPNELYQPYINNVSNTVSISNYSAAWSSYINNLGDDTILSLKFCAEILPSDPDCDFESLEEILSLIKQLREEVESSNIHKSTVDFVLSQILIIENAILNYPISGGDAIRKAFSEGFSDVCAKANTMADEDAPVKSKVGQCWLKLKSAGGVIVEADKIANALVKLVDNGQKLSESVAGLLQ